MRILPQRTRDDLNWFSILLAPNLLRTSFDGLNRWLLMSLVCNFLVKLIDYYY